MLISEVEVERETLGIGFSKGDLKCVVGGVLVIPVVVDALGPAARSTARRERSANITLQECRVGGYTVLYQRSTRFYAATDRVRNSARDAVGTSRITISALRIEAKRTASHTVLGGQGDRRLVGIGVIAITVAKGMSALVADVSRRDRDGGRKRTLNWKRSTHRALAAAP